MKVVAVDDRRRSRKSFIHSVSHPDTPAAFAAQAGIGMDAKELLSTGARKRASRPMFTAIDAYGQPRAELSVDGCFSMPGGAVLGYMNADGSVGSADMRYLGAVSLPADPSTT
eukprot:4565007-Prymnesium_polylepis.1